jgi:protocatechuate 3,4-dioxygenase beta subunit
VISQPLRSLARAAAFAAAGLTGACGVVEGEGLTPEMADLSHRLVLASAEEPGERLHLRGTLRDPVGTPLPGRPVQVFQTDAEGYYRRGPDGRDLGWRRARLSAWLRTDEDGRFEVETIRPGGYPGRRSPAHLHFRTPAPHGGGERELTLYFEEDPRLTPEMRDHLTRFPHNVIRPLVRDTEGTWRCTVDLALPG